MFSLFYVFVFTGQMKSGEYLANAGNDHYIRFVDSIKILCALVFYFRSRSKMIIHEGMKISFSYSVIH